MRGRTPQPYANMIVIKKYTIDSCSNLHSDLCTCNVGGQHHSQSHHMLLKNYKERF